ncbi:MAG: fluoride efflux transporter CrcB [Cyanobacteria bacterium REEB65]|nr:fluoride efflux transporter CrcB [Cyanobacteria bacterium REEB65]
MKDFFLVGFGGWIGAICRYYFSQWLGNRLGTSFPYGTLIINLSGSLILGILLGYTLERMGALPREARLLFGVGFLGAYTTFSTFTYESVQLLREGDIGLAFGYVAGSVIVGLLASYLGIILGRLPA